MFSFELLAPGFAARAGRPSLLRSISRRSGLVATVLGLSFVLGAAAGRADDDEVDIAFEVLGPALAAVGVNLGTTEKTLAKSLVRCAMKGETVVNCARDELVKTLPEQAQPFASCLLKGGSPDRCMKEGAIQQLPPQAQGLATCIAREADVVGCGKKFALDQGQAAAFNTLDALKVSASRDLGGPVPGPLQNIIGMAEGIRDDDWPKVIRHGGTEAAKIAGKALMRAFLGPLAAPLDPAVDAIIESRIDLAARLFGAVKNGDVTAAAGVAAEVLIYLNLPIAQVCGLIPDGGFKEITCGTAQKIINAFAGAGSDVADFGIGVGRDLANALGFDVGEFVSACGRSDAYYAKDMAACWSHAAFYKLTDPDKYNKLEASLNNLCRNHYQPCHSGRIFASDSERLSEICNPLRERFRRDSSTLIDGLREAAARYASSYPPFVLDLESGEDCQARASQKFFADCVRDLGAQYPVQGDGPQRACMPGGQQLGAPLPISNVCMDAAFVEDRGKLRLNFRGNCRYPVEKRPPTELSMGGTGGRPATDALVPPTLPIDRRPPTELSTGGTGGRPATDALGGRTPPTSQPPPPCPAGWTGVHPTCCPPGRFYQNGTCVRQTAGPPTIPIGPRDPPTSITGPRAPPPPGLPPPSCPAGWAGVYPTCCQPGTFYRNGSCMQIANPLPPPSPPREHGVRCPDGSRVSHPALCRNPPTTPGIRCADGSRVSHIALCRKRCPDGTTVRMSASCPSAPSQPPTTPGVRCPDGSRAAHYRYCRKRCPDGTSVRASASCPSPSRPSTPYGVRCPDGSRAAHYRYCRKRPATPRQQCRMVRTCVQYERGTGGTFVGRCLRYENRRSCPSNVN